MKLWAFRIENTRPMEIVQAPPTRDWMGEVAGVGACLPVKMANQAGWWLLNPVGFTVYRSGDATNDLWFHIDGGAEPPHHAISHFGNGVLTFIIPYIFRTPPGWSLLFRGPTSHPKDGIVPFEGLVETDWHSGSTTMNWWITTLMQEIRFEAGEPICQIVPVNSAILEGFDCTIADMPGELQKVYREWDERRGNTIAQNEASTGKIRYEGGYPRTVYHRKLNLASWEKLGRRDA